MMTKVKHGHPGNGSKGKVIREQEDRQAEESNVLMRAVCDSYLAHIGKPHDLFKVCATQVGGNKWRVNVYRRSFGLTDYALVIVDEAGKIIGHQPDRAKGDRGLTKRY